jgi:hypothetical protein
MNSSLYQSAIGIVIILISLLILIANHYICGEDPVCQETNGHHKTALLFFVLAILWLGSCNGKIRFD